MASMSTFASETPGWMPAPDSVPADIWKAGLRRFNSGAPIPQLANVIHALKHAPQWAGVLAFDEFALNVVSKMPTPWSTSPEIWTDNHDRKTAEWLQHQSINVSVETAAHGIQAVALENRFHPLRDFLTALKWDGKKRLNNWPTVYLGAEKSQLPFGEKFLISAVARALRAGVKVDHITVLEGNQGIKKSSAVEELFKPYFCDYLPDLGSKDAFLQLRGLWCVEISELAALGRSGVERIKGFLSARVDRYRPPYGRRPIDVPRACVFVGTTNSDTYLLDETGNRRFWPIKCGSIDLTALRRDRDQLLAEAVTRFQNGITWWLDPDQLRDAEEAQEQRLSLDAWHESIQRWIEDPTQKFDHQGHPVGPFVSRPGYVSVQDVLVHCVGKTLDKVTQVDSNRVARVLKTLKWERRKVREGKQTPWRYVPSVPTFVDERGNS